MRAFGLRGAHGSAYPRPAGRRVLAGWVDYENEMTHLSVVDVAADKELAAQTLEGCWELQTEQFTDGSAVLFNWDGGAW